MTSPVWDYAISSPSYKMSASAGDWLKAGEGALRQASAARVEIAALRAEFAAALAARPVEPADPSAPVPNDEVVAELAQRVVELTERVAELTARLDVLDG
jgi:hypothetical protein